MRVFKHSCSVLGGFALIFEKNFIKAIDYFLCVYRVSSNLGVGRIFESYANCCGALLQTKYRTWIHLCFLIFLITGYCYTL